MSLILAVVKVKKNLDGKNVEGSMKSFATVAMPPTRKHKNVYKQAYYCTKKQSTVRGECYNGVKEKVAYF